MYDNKMPVVAPREKAWERIKRDFADDKAWQAITGFVYLNGTLLIMWEVARFIEKIFKLESGIVLWLVEVGLLAIAVLLLLIGASVIFDGGKE